MCFTNVWSVKSKETTRSFGKIFWFKLRSIESRSSSVGRQRVKRMDEFIVALLVMSVISIAIHELFGTMRRRGRTVTVADACTQTESLEERSSCVQTDVVDERLHGRIPLEIAVPRTGHCFHVPSCYHIRNRQVTTFRRCMDCLH